MNWKVLEKSDELTVLHQELDSELLELKKS